MPFETISKQKFKIVHAHIVSSTKKRLRISNVLSLWLNFLWFLYLTIVLVKDKHLVVGNIQALKIKIYKPQVQGTSLCT